MTKRMLIMLGCVGLLFGGIFGYKAFVAHMIAKKMSANQAPPVTVSTTTAQKERWQPRISAVGTVRASDGVDVTTEIAGLVRSIHFKSGDDVKQGQVLVQLNADSDVARLHSLEAEAELARTTYERDRRQFAVKAISQAVLDVSRADLKSKQAQVKQQAAIVEKKTITAPFDGRIGISTVSPGQYLNPGSPIATLQAIDMVYVDFTVPQQEIAQIKLGQSVSVTTDTYPDHPFQGTITAFNAKVDPQTRNIEIEATLDNSRHRLLPGMFAEVQLETGQAVDHITLPQTAVTYNPYGETVYIVTSGEKNSSAKIAKQIFVTVGPKRGDQVAILKGLQADATVITSGQMKLKNGSRITVNNDIQPSNDPEPRPTDQ